MADIGWRRRRGSRSPKGRAAARGLDPASASNTLSCQRETLHSQQLRSIKKSIDSDHGIYQPDRYGATRPRSGSSRPPRARRGGKIALSIPAPEGERFGA